MRKIAISFTTIFLIGCANTSPIEPAITSKSKFEDAVYNGETVVLSTKSTNSEQFRLFHKGSASWVSIKDVRASVVQEANEYCGRLRKIASPVQETHSVPPHILGNFPRVELIFTCEDKPKSNMDENDKILQLEKLKKLLDEGVLTKSEFDIEKAKILN